MARTAPWHRALAEAVVTSCLVLAGTGAIVIDDVSGSAVTHVGAGLDFGLVVTAMIFAIGEQTGVDLNPAVTPGFLLAQRFPARDTLPYVIAQCVGALDAPATHEAQ